MSKRKLTKQQQQRIKAQEERHDDTASETFQGLVIARFGSKAEIETAQSTRLICAIRPNLKDIVAGDQVLFIEEGQQQGVVVKCIARKSSLYRQSPRRKKLIAANVTQLMIVLAPKPHYSSLLLDSYLVVAELNHIKATLVINKTDLPVSELMTEIDHIYKPLGYPILKTSQITSTKDYSLNNQLADEVSVFVGQSGVGKSSIINRLLPEESIQTAAISHQAELGKHTTSQSRYYHLPTGGAIIDSPGIREFGLWGIEKRVLYQGFKEIYPFMQTCRFRDCDHQKSPGCAVLEALSQGEVSPSRYHSLIQLIHQFETPSY